MLFLLYWLYNLGHSIQFLRNHGVLFKSAAG